MHSRNAMRQAYLWSEFIFNSLKYSGNGMIFIHNCTGKFSFVCPKSARINDHCRHTMNANCKLTGYNSYDHIPLIFVQCSLINGQGMDMVQIPENNLVASRKTGRRSESAATKKIV